MNNTIEFSNLWDGSAPHSTVFDSQIGKSAYSIKFSFDINSGSMIIDVDAPFFNDPPPTFPPGRMEGLWDHEVVEIFLAPGVLFEDVESSPYLEIEIGPFGHYYLCMFPSQGDFYNKNDEIDLDRVPRVLVDHTRMRWSASLSIPSYLLPEPDCKDDLSICWMMNACAIHGQTNSRVHHSYSPVPGKKPNFHQLRSFVPLLLQEGSATVPSPPTDSVVMSPKSKAAALKKIQFSPSTVNADNSNRLIEELGLKKKLDNGKSKHPNSLGSALDDNSANINEKAPSLTLVDVASSLRTKYPLPVLDEVYRKNVHPDEFVVLYGIVWKRKGWSLKRRMLVLTSKPRLFYLTTFDQKKYQGFIPWTLTNPIEVTKISSSRFDVTVSDKSRTYHWMDNGGGADRWVDSIQTLNEAWKSYLKTNIR